MRDRTATRVATGRARSQSPRNQWRRTRVVTGMLLASTSLLTACGGDQSSLDPAGPYAQEPHDLITIVAIIALIVFVLVQGLVILAAVRFREKSDDDGSLPVQVHGNTRMEIIWTVVPAVILAVIAVPTVQMIFSTMDEPDGDFLTVEVVGHRWWWEYYYPDYDVYTANELVIPAGTPVRLEMTAADPARSPDQGVIHSFWIPRLAGKQDVVPGQTTTLNLEANDPDQTFIGQCAEYCGLSHVNMRARVRTLDQAGFDAWVQEQQTPAAAPDAGAPEAEGRDLFADLGARPACAQCHQVWDGEAARSPGVGPDLTHLLSREVFAGAIHDLTEDNLREWLADPNAMKSMQYEHNGIGMPNLDLSDDEIDALVAYLLTLE